MIPDDHTRGQNCHLPRQIQGAGGQKQQEVQVQEQYEPEQEEPRDPVEQPDSLRSNSYARVLDLICEGEIEGLVDAAGNLLTKPATFGKAVFLDETPLQNRNGKYNFQDVQVAMTWGTQDQDALKGFGRAEDVIFSGQKFTTRSPVVVGIDNPDADRVLVAVRLPGLLRQITSGEKSGDILGAKVKYRVQIKHLVNGVEMTGWVQSGKDLVIAGKASGPFSFQTAHRLPRSTTPGAANTWQVRLVRITPDSNTIALNNETHLEYVTIQTKNKFRYPNSVVIGCAINARGFQNIPRRAYRVRGLKVQVPDNYFPLTRTYNRDRLTGQPIVDGAGNPVTQKWLGGFYTAWTQNPAWCFYDLITSKRYGLGDYMPASQVDKWTLYSIAQYCDEDVDDGMGGLEPRFQCNLVMAGREEAFKVVQDMASIFRGMVYWDQGTIVAVQDRPKAPVKTFTTANVLQGVFTYSGTGKRARHTVAHVRWNDPGDMHRPKFEYVEDAPGILKYGVRTLELAAFGCSSRGQAHRLGRWTLLTELNETETVSFNAGQEAAYLRPGDIFQVLDTNRSGNANAGRIKAISGDRLKLTLDRPVTLGASPNSISLARPQANVNSVNVVDSDQIGSLRTAQIHTVNIVEANVTTEVVTLTAAAPAEVDLAAVYCVTTVDVKPQLFRVLTVAEQGPMEYAVTGLEYNPDKFAATEADMVLEEPAISDLDLMPGEVLMPQDVTIDRTAAIDPTGNALLKLVLAWTAPPEYPFVEGFKVQWRRGEDNWTDLVTTAANMAEATYTQAGIYEMRVCTVSRLGGFSPWVVATYEVDSESPIELFAVTGLELVGQAQGTNFEGLDARFQWRLNSPAVTGQLGLESDGKPDPFLRDYEVTLWDIQTNEMVHRESTINPFFSFTYEKNASSVNGPRAQFRIEVRGRDKWLNMTKPATLVVQNPAPGPCTDLAVTAAFKTVFLTWTPPADRDVAVVEIYESTVNDFSQATKVGEVEGKTNAWSRAGVQTGTTLFYWVRPRDTFGTLGTRTPLGGGITTTPGSVGQTDLANFAVTASKQWSQAVILEGDVWTNNSPAAGSITWNSHTLYHRGVAYGITGSSTAAQYVFWDPESPEAGYQAQNDNPLTAASASQADQEYAARLFTIATNVGGIVDQAWHGLANAVIGSAHIQNLAVTNAHIQDLVADKIKSGTIDAQLIQIAGALGAIQSEGYQEGVQGWRVDGAGNAYLNTATIRGTLAAGTIFTDAKLARPALPTYAFHSSAMLITNKTGTHNHNTGGAAAPTIRLAGTTFAEKTVKTLVFCPTTINVNYPFNFYGPTATDTGAAAQYVERYRVGSDLPTFILDFRCRSNAGNKHFAYRLIPPGTVDRDAGTVWYILRHADDPTRNLITGTELFKKALMTVAMNTTQDYLIEFGIIPCNEDGTMSASYTMADPELTVMILNW